MVEANHTDQGPAEVVSVKKQTLQDKVNASGASEAKNMINEMEHELQRQEYI